MSCGDDGTLLVWETSTGVVRVWFYLLLQYYRPVPLQSSAETPGGVLRYISDGDVRSPFLGLKFTI